jgi:hypothetical protein
MAHLTPAETERIIQVCIQEQGPTPQAVMAGWRAMVSVMLERLDLGRHRARIIPLVCEVIELWAAVQLAYTWPKEHRFVYEGDEMEPARNLFLGLNNVAMDIVLALSELPPRSDEDSAWALGTLDAIADYVRTCVQQLDAFAGEGAFYITAAEMRNVAGRCMNLVAVILGPVHIDSFQEQYNACIGTWSQMTRAAAMPSVGRGAN